MMTRGIWWRLAGMMVLVYSVQGAFWPLLAVHLQDLGIDGRWRGAIFGTMALGAMLVPLVAGQIVDRRVSIQRFMSLIALLGTGVLAVLALGTIVAPGVLFGLFLVYWLVTAPTTSLSTTLALRNLARPHQDFAGVRLWGTIGWMAAGWLVTGVLTWSGSTRAGQGAYEAFGVAAALSGLLASYCLTLPNTPPVAVGPEDASGLREALELIRRPLVAVFLATAFGVGLTTPFVYQVIPPYLESRGLPRPWISTVMTLGQYPEIATLAILPWIFRRLRYKGTLALGIAANVVRYASLAPDPPLWVAIVGIPLHGVGIACFTVSGQVFLDSQAPTHRRASAQGLLMVLTTGIGSLAGSLIAGEMSRRYPGEYPLVFLIPFLINLGLLVAFCVGFHPDPSHGTSAWLHAGHRKSGAALAPEPADS
jgi:MFS family permease